MKEGKNEDSRKKISDSAGGDDLSRPQLGKRPEPAVKRKEKSYLQKVGSSLWAKRA